MLPSHLEKQINELCDVHAPARPVIDAVVAHFTGQNQGTDSSVPSDAIEYVDMSLVLPQRRKCSLFLHEKGLWVVANESILLESKWSDIVRCMLLPVPDKPKPTWNLILAKHDPANTIAFALSEFSADKFKRDAKPAPIRQVLAGDIELNSSLTVETEFTKAVTAHIGSKEGTLYLLDDALVYGLKKPILVLPHSSIMSISFTVITRMTFNLAVELSDETMYEFSMIDQDDFPQISDYINSYGLSDRSLAEDRAAKRSKPDESLAVEADNTAAAAFDDDDRESDLDVVFNDNELDSDGSGQSESEGEPDVEDVDLNNTHDINEQIDAAQADQLDYQQQDEDDDEEGFDAMDAWDTNFN